MLYSHPATAHQPSRHLIIRKPTYLFSQLVDSGKLGTNGFFIVRVNNEHKPDLAYCLLISQVSARGEPSINMNLTSDSGGNSLQAGT